MKSPFIAKTLIRRVMLLCAGMCLFISVACTQTLKFGNSYVNLSKRQVGGTVQPGDTLEIRNTIFVRSNYNMSGRIYFVRYLDNVPTHTTMLTTDSLRLITNEGLTFRRYTVGADADAGTYLALPPAGEFNVRINMGGAPTSAEPTAGLNNSIADITGAQVIRGNNNRPRAASGTLVSTSFKVVVTGNYGDTITLGAGQIRFKKANFAADPDTVLNATQYRILIAPNASVCADNVGANFASEFGGTFGTGTTLNRAAPPSFLIPSYTYIPNMSLANQVGDGFYSIVNNTSPRASTFINARRVPNCSVPPGPHPPTDSCNNRMFNGYWYIHGDHTGTANAIGNTPVADGTNGGYMLMVNADLATSEAYRQTITGLCPNTNYEFSVWVKNICPTCGIDSNSAATYRPGVLPNLTLVIDGIDRYSSGQMDTVGWMKKGFLFRTDTSQTDITISIRNNAPGGGGNDWVIDDITLATCTPQLNLVPTGNSNVCYGDQVDMNCLVRSYFDNYINWEWEQSTDGGTNWTSTGVSGTGTPALVGGSYEYTAAYPSFLADSSVHNTMFRIKVATTATNLATSTCSFEASNTIVVLVNNCTEVLKTELLSFDGRLQDGYSNLQWKTDNEQPATIYYIERSDDGRTFERIGSLNAKAPSGFGSLYTFKDNRLVSSGAFYRLRISEASNHKFSKTIYLSSKSSFALHSLVNPFQDNLSFELTTPRAGSVRIKLLDLHGRMVYQSSQKLNEGTQSIRLSDINRIPAGTYTLQVQMDDQVLNRRVIKLNR